jgi:hypothetical protein
MPNPRVFTGLCRTWDFEVGWGYVNQVDIVGDDRSSRRQLLTAE